jgi:MYXO-CTERM domain-containing protein
MQTLLTIFLVGSALLAVWALALSGLGYAFQRCRRLIGRLSKRQHSS